MKVPPTAGTGQRPDWSGHYLEQAPLAMALVEGAAHIVRYVNPAFCHLLDQPAAQFVGKPFPAMVTQQDGCAAMLDRVFRTGISESHSEQHQSQPQGVFWSFTMWPVLEDGRPVGVMVKVAEHERLQEKTVAMNAALILGSVHQHELAEASQNLNARLLEEIAERKHTQEALRQSEERIRSLFASAPMAIFVCDQNGVIENYNLRAVELWGRAPVCGVEKQCGSLKLWLPDGTLLPHARSPIVDVLRTGIPAFNVEVFVERPDGSRLPVLVNFAALKNAQGGITGAITSFMDITERKKMEDTLRMSEERFRAFVTASSDAVYRMSPDWSEMLHLQGRQFVVDTDAPSGTWLQEYIDPDDQAHVMVAVNEAIRTRSQFELEHRVRRVDGTLGWTYSRAIPLFDAKGEIIEWFGAATDVTERKWAMEALREAGERFRFLAESMPQKLFTAKPDGSIDYINRQWTEFTGLTFEEIRDGGSKQLIHPDDLEETARRWRQSITAGAALQLEHRCRREDGEYRWHLTRANPMRNAGGNITMWIGSSTDIHEVKEADVRKNEFLAMLAHELRNPLAPLRSMLEIVTRAEGNGDLIKPALATMDRQVRHMTRLIDDLLDVSRISRNKIVLLPEEIELASVIHQVVEAARSGPDSDRRELSVTLPPQPVYLRADPVRLTQVFGNLLHNAYKFTGLGGRISLSAETQAEEVVVTIRDSGIGIPSDMLPNIFEMFAQGDQSLERSQGGLGIGLSLVRRLVTMHGGSVHAFSDGANRGSEFVVRLPALSKKSDSVSAEPPAGDPNAIAATHRILVVDDNHDAADALSILLTLSGNETHLAFDGEEAVQAAEKFRPEVILLDLGMPKLNGYDAARRIREQPWGKDMMLVAMTGWGQDEDRRKTANAGFDAHLVKPVELALLTELLAGYSAGGRSVGVRPGSGRS